MTRHLIKLLGVRLDPRAGIWVSETKNSKNKDHNKRNNYNNNSNKQWKMFGLVV